jgi:hypothetical protein
MSKLELSRLIMAIAIWPLSVSCAERVSEPRLDATNEFVYLASACDGELRDHTMLSASELVIDPGISGDICVENNAVVRYKASRLRIIPYKSGRVAVKFECVNDDDEREFYSNARGRNAVLVAGDKALGVFRTNGVASQACGLFPVGDISEAIDICIAATSRWHMEADACMQLCGSNSSDDSVCVEHGDSGAPG